MSVSYFYFFIFRFAMALWGPSCLCLTRYLQFCHHLHINIVTFVILILNVKTVSLLMLQWYVNNYYCHLYIFFIITIIRQNAKVVVDSLTTRFVVLSSFSQKLIELMLETTLLQGFVKARLAMFDKPAPKPSRKLVSGDKGWSHWAWMYFLIFRFPDSPKRTENVQAVEDSRERKREEERSKRRFVQSAPKTPRA